MRRESRLKALEIFAERRLPCFWGPLRLRPDRAWRKGVPILMVVLILLLPACMRSEESSSGDPPSSAAYAEEGHHEEDHHEEGLPGDIVEIDPNSEELAGIEVTESRLLSFRDFLETTGVVSANQGRLAHIRPLSRGIVKEVFVLPGDDVAENQSLLQYDNIEMSELMSEYQSRKADLRRAEAELEVARKLWERGKRLLEAQAIAERDLDLRRVEYRKAEETTEILRSEVEKVEAKLRRYGMDEGVFEDPINSDTENPMGNSLVRAPFAGTILDFDVSQGEVISPERVLVSIADLSTVWVLADIYERDIGRVEKTTGVEISVESYPDRTFRGRITYLGDRVAPETRTVKVRCEVPNPGRRLKLGMYCKVRIPLESEHQLPAVPLSALQTVDGKETVFVESGPHRFERRTVRTGPDEWGWVAIEEGLAAGEKVASWGSFTLKSELHRERLGGGHAH